MVVVPALQTISLPSRKPLGREGGSAGSNLRTRTGEEHCVLVQPLVGGIHRQPEGDALLNDVEVELASKGLLTGGQNNESVLLGDVCLLLIFGSFLLLCFLFRCLLLRCLLLLLFWP